MTRLEDIAAMVHVSYDWRLAARCRGVDVEMVPGPEGASVSEGAEILAVEIQAAKRLCRFCPVKERCLADANRSVGVWGGLTLEERERIRVSTSTKAGRSNQKREVVLCAQCDLDCVPWNKKVDKCDACLTDSEKPKSVEAHKDSIIAMILDGYNYGEVADRFGLRPETVGKACRRWESPSKRGKRGRVGTSDEDDMAPCGTPARLRRHERDGDTDLKCACAQPGHAKASRTKANGWVV